MINIRECQIKDFDSIIPLLQELWPDKKLNTQLLFQVYERSITNNFYKYFCACDDFKIIGFGTLSIKHNLWQEGNLAHVDELVVNKQFRDKGIGTQLLNTIINRAIEMGCRRIELDSAFHRKEAHRFYESKGFENRAFLFSKSL